MPTRVLHAHSMVVHAVIALSFAAAAAFVLDSTQTSLGHVGPETWAFLWRGGLLAALLTSLPATITGISERNHMYANWHGSHKAKLALSAALAALVAAELGAALLTEGSQPPAPWLAAAVVMGNPLLCLALSFCGLRITLGRQSLRGTSYVADMDRVPPVDILDTAAAHVGERARVTEVLEEQR